MVGFGREEVTNICQLAMNSSEIFLPTADARRFREQLSKLDTHCHHMRIQLLSMRDMLDHEDLEFTALVDIYYRMTNELRRLLSDSDCE